ncbi:hemerythrin domain-containing protein [Moraxella equi]|uniref:Uncharacterized conserved protein n=1 Tax=Moraxella equi TaxID=60442 RepID=A0A378QN56_9GAMM|nr:hemerythrin domain-containing protein [Moraxella equi]STZ02208.1 Uncharacterized conserved protein [Moraxella equi]
MKRHPALQPLSRQHHLGLVIANKAKSATDDDKLTHHQALVDYLTTAIPTHFEVERTCLADVILTKLSDDKAVKLAKQMLDEHEYIESLLSNTDPSVDDVKELANALYDHIRFEERELFPIAETVLSDDEFFAIYTNRT